MNIDAAFFVAASGIMTLIFLGFIIYGYKSGQFKDLKNKRYDLTGGEDE